MSFVSLEDTLANLSLGDIVAVPDGRSLTVRCVTHLNTPVGSMRGFVLLGELELLLAIPSAASVPAGVYLPVERFPASAGSVRAAAEGISRYWAPHLPGFGQAMGEVTWRVVIVEGSVDPIVIVWRGVEAVVFVRTSHTWGDDLQFLFMECDPANEQVAVTRHAGDVAVTPAYPPSPVREREHAGRLFETVVRPRR